MKLSNTTGYFILTIIISIPIFWHLNYLPIQLWDESRLAINSLEMYKNHNWLVTYYNNMPDLWNTKPPLLIWLQVISLKIFGINELAIRLPSAFAGMFTCFLLYWFIQKKFNNTWLALLSCFVLITSYGFIKYHHSPRTGDYDSLLTFFCLAYCVFFYLYLDENKRKYLIYTFVFLILASLTKGIQSLIFVPALFIFTIIHGDIKSIFTTKLFYIGVLSYCGIVLGYYLLRNHYNHGYISAVIKNEFTERALHSQYRAHGKKYYYNLLINSHFNYWYWYIFPGSFLGILSKKQHIRNLFSYLILLSIFYFIIISISECKLNWYDMPIYPFLSIIVAFFIYEICCWLWTQRYFNVNYRFNIIPFALLFFICALPFKSIIHATLNPDTGSYQVENENMAFLMKEILHNKRNHTDEMHVTWYKYDYQANIEWYLEVFKDKNYPIKFADYLHLNSNQKVIAYEDSVKQYICNHYRVHILDSQNNIITYQIDTCK